MSYQTPGVYVDAGEGPSPAPINALDTRHAAFLGRIPPAWLRPGALLNTPVLVHSFAEFSQQFLAQPNGVQEVPAGYYLANAVAGYFVNGGDVLWVVALAEDSHTLTADAVALLDNVEPVSQIAAPGYTDAASHAQLVAHCESHLARLAVLDTPAEVEDWHALAQPEDAGGLRPPHVPRGRAAIYAPWLRMRDALTDAETWAPPSGHLCGVIARNDKERGPHKAPANLEVEGVTALRHAFTDAQQHDLNPAGINLIREIRGAIRVWGARSLAPAGSEWQLLPVRRLADMILYSVRVGLGWTATEPHDSTMHAQIQGQVSHFLQGLFERGYLAGRSPEQAFFVRCDDSNNGSGDLQSSRVHLEIGIAALRPAEFHVLHLSMPTRGSRPASASGDTAAATAVPAHHGHPDQYRTGFVSAADRDDWEPLFRAYAEFYEVQLEPETITTVWDWLLDAGHELQGLLTRDTDGRAVGLAHVRACPRPLAGSTIGFLDDLYVLPEARGEGAAEALFQALSDLAAKQGWPALRWLTRQDNDRARAFYDRHTGGATDFLLYHWERPAD